MGRITPEIVVIGLGLTAVLSLFLYKGLGYTPERERRLLKSVPMLLLYALNLLREIVISSVAVAGLALSTTRHPEPVLVEFYSGLERDSLNVLLANSITLTPGTITVFQEKDHFLIHALRREYAEGLEDSSFVHLLRRFPP